MVVMAEADWRPFVYGGLASCVAEFGTFPIDTTKTRLQVQGQRNSLHTELRYRGMTHALVEISKQEGFRALYAGIAPAVLRQATYGTIKFGTYYSLKKYIAESRGHEVEDVFTNVLCAITAGMVSSAIANPTDVLKVRMQIRGDQHNLLSCFLDVYRLEGVGGLWRGVGPTAQRAAIIAAVELPVYDFCKSHLKLTIGDTVYNHFISSFIASLGSAIASTPVDVIRTRLMNQRKFKSSAVPPAQSAVHLYKGSVDCFVLTVRHEGVRALYKGFIPTWVRMGPWNIIFFITYEQMKKLY